MAKFKFSDLKKSSLYITPNFPVLTTRRYKFSFRKVLSTVAIYTTLVAIAVIVLLALTPARQVVFFLENKELSQQAERIEELEKKVILLTRELSNVASKNRRLQYAIILAGTDSVDSSSAIYDSLRSTTTEEVASGGNIAAAFRSLISWLQREDTLFTGSEYFIKPSNGFVVKKFTPDKGHLGIDFGVKSGSPVFASMGGTVIFSDYTATDGNLIIIEHPGGYITVYKHCSVMLRKVRDNVVQGEVIALSGNSGYNSTGPHLHFEIWKNGKAIDPEKVLINNRS